MQILQKGFIVFYKVTKTQIKEDASVWKTGESLNALSRRTGINLAIISRLHSGKRIPSERKYLEYKKKILGSIDK